MNGRRLTPLGARVTYLGFAIAVLAGLLGNRPLLLAGVALGLLPLVSAAALPRPFGQTRLMTPYRMTAHSPVSIMVQFDRPSGRSSAPLTLSVKSDLWKTVPARLGPLAAGTQTRTTFELVPPTRGIVRQVGVHLEARDPLGLAYISLLASPNHQTRIIHPAAVSCPPLPLYSAERIPEFAGLRGWQPGDQPRNVDWRATARRPGTAPVVRLWEETETRGGTFTVGVVSTADPEVNDRIAELAAAAIRQALVTHDAVTLRWTDGELTAGRAEPLLDVLAEHPRLPETAPTVPPGCDLLIGPPHAHAGTARHLWRVDGKGHVATG
jgi:uncharacterized protein (DUF58 family)